MINRRHLRIKVMQALYSHEQMNENAVDVLTKNLYTSIRYVYQLFLYHLHILERSADYVISDAQFRASKHLPSEEDKNFVTRLFDNPVFAYLRNNKAFNDLLKREKLVNRFDNELVKMIYNTLKKSEIYKNYLSKSAIDLQDEKEIATYLYKEVMLASEVFEHHIEDLFSSWLDDKDVVVQTMINFIKDFSQEKSNHIIRELSENLTDEADEIKFAGSLLHASILHEQQCKELITPKLENWDLERIAQVDLILLRMALCEMLYFDSIPVKVSINEYIDISKLYSTPKSREFINGVLDKLMKELREEGKIVKKGRGLVE